MYDRSAMHRAASYPYSQYSTPTASSTMQQKSHHSSSNGTSSAFSASANPNEDWTKISDLAERRRIQNRIAQRNYRKKLKKRLEDLEKRAGSDSASPESKPQELAQNVDDAISTPASSSRHSSLGSPVRQGVEIVGRAHRSSTPDVINQQYALSNEDRSMFLEQYTRQISTSPPPFSYNAYSGPMDGFGYSAYAQPTAYCGAAIPSMDASLFLPTYSMDMYQAHGSSTTLPPIKTDMFGDDEMNPFVSAYASMAGVDVSHYNTADKAAAYTPPLLVESIEPPSPGPSPIDAFAMPLTPESWLSSTPPELLFDN